MLTSNWLSKSNSQFDVNDPLKSQLYPLMNYKLCITHHPLRN